MAQVNTMAHMRNASSILAFAILAYFASDLTISTEAIKRSPSSTAAQVTRGNSHSHQELTRLLRRGDIIARMGTGRWSQLIQKLNPSNNELSHVGLISRTNDAWSVIHAIGGRFDGPNAVIITPLSEFIENSERFEIYRSTYIEEIQNVVASCAESLVGTPFDHRFDLNDETEVYCTELVFITINKAHDKLLIKPTRFGNNKHMITIKDCLDFPNCRLIHKSK